MSTRMRTRTMAITAACALSFALSACQGGGSSDPSPSTAAPAAPSGDSSAETTSASQSSAEQQKNTLDSCHVPGGDNKIPTTAPEVDAWVDVAGVGVPTSKKYGPFVKDGDLWQCYQHSPTGALFAAAYTFAGPENVPNFWKYWAPAAEKDKLTAENDESETADVDARIVGYQFLSATPQKVVINLAVEVKQNGQSGIVAVKTGLTWEDGKWLRDVSDSSAGITNMGESMEGYTRWSANA